MIHTILRSQIHRHITKSSNRFLFNQSTTKQFTTSAIRYSYQQQQTLNRFQNSQQIEDKKYKEYQEKERNKKKWFRRIQITVATIVSTSSILYLWQPWNPYSSKVSRSLRAALWAESDKEDYNYVKALKQYQLALKYAKEEGMDDLDRRYTGIVLKIAQMYEKLENYELEIETYTKLSNFLFSKLVNGQVDEEFIDLTIQRDLLVTSRLVELISMTQKKVDEELLTELWDRLVFAESRLRDKWGFLTTLKTTKQKFEIWDVLKISDWPSKKNFIELYLNDKSLQFWSQWFPKLPVFLSDLIAAKDLYSALTISNKPEISISLMQSNLLWMKLSDLQPIYLGTVIQNIATAYYYKSQNHELNIKRLNNRMTNVEVLEDEEQMKQLKKYLKNEESNRIEALRLSESMYLSLISSSASDASKQSNQDLKLQSCLAMSLYSLGAIYYDRRDYVNSQKFLESAREKALEFAMVQIIDKVDGLMMNMEHDRNNI